MTTNQSLMQPEIILLPRGLNLRKSFLRTLVLVSNSPPRWILPEASVSLFAFGFGRCFIAKIARLDIIAVEVEYERGIVVIAVFPSKSGRAIVCGPGLHRIGMKLLHRLFVFTTHSDMDRLHLARLFHDP